MERSPRPLSALGLCLATLLLVSSPAAAEETLLLQDPTVSAEHVVFVYAGDLWIVGRDGGDARRLTSSSGSESSPKLSPDGARVAFSGQYEGNTDVYVISVDGGTPTRLTWHPGSDSVVDWHPDGERVLFRSSRASGPPVSRLFLATLDGATPTALEVPKAYHASYDADASHLAYTPFRDAFRSWKRHRGGTTATIWIYDTATHEVEVVPHVNASDTFPAWLNGIVYFASDRDGSMNLYRFAPGSSDVEQLTRFTDFDVRNMDAGGGVVVFEQAGALHLFDPATGRSERLTVRVRTDGLAALPRWQKVEGHVRDAAIAPNGKRAVFEARGEIITLPREHGDARNLTESPGVHERSPAWSNDGTRIAWFSDEGGEYRLWVGDRLGRGEPRIYSLGEGGFYNDPVWSPNDEHILFSDKTNRLAYVTLESGRITEIATVQGSLGEVQPRGVWSPDSKWIAFENRNPLTLYDHIALYELASGTTTSVTDGFGAAGDPAFSRDGEHLFFQATVDAGPKLFGLDMSTSASRPASGNLYVAVLQRDGENPLAPESDEAVGDEDDEDEDDEDGARGRYGKEKDGDDDEEKEIPPVELAGLDQRILALPLDDGRYRGLECSRDKLLFIEAPRDGKPALKSFDFEEREAETVRPDVSGFDVSADGRWLLTVSGDEFHIIAADSKAGREGPPRGEEKESKALKIGSVLVRVEPQEEWPQMLHEVWRIQRDYFYDGNMHGVDWPAMWERWQAFLPHVQHRDDLTVLIREMIGELSCGHQYTWGGERPDAPTGVSVGLLGADWTVSGGRYRIAKVYRGQNWNPELRAPLTEPGIDAQEGDYLVAVNGRPLSADENVFQRFENTAGRQTSITLSISPDGSNARTMTVVPIRSESRLRRQSWVEANRARVDELSDGRLAYIYMPNTADAGRAAFDRDFYSQLDKEGVVLDERYNGGGQVANYVIETLSREVMSYWMNREGWLGRSPWGVIEGPAVMVINESAGSGGDWMPWVFQNRGLGPLVGTRTWGGLVGISGYPPLMDGGTVTAASFGVMDTNGQWAVENVGVSPDVEVVEWPAEVIAGNDPQLEKAVELAMAELEGRVSARPASFQRPAAR